MKSSRIVGLIVAGTVIVGLILFLENLRPANTIIAPNANTAPIVPAKNSTTKANRFQSAQEIVAPSGYVNTAPFTIQSLIGKQVILVDFWTYSCINCQRTTPYLNAWQEAYGDNGLTIVGVHTPEFSFEKKLSNVEAAVKKFGIKYPVVLDNDYGTWQAYGNRYWPRKYLIDIDGYIVYDHIGEGGYDETEQKIRELLAERQTRLGETAALPADMAQPVGVQVVDTSGPRSPEIYFGADRNEYLANGLVQQAGQQTLTPPNSVKSNRLYLVGDWKFDREYAQNVGAGKIIFRYQGQNVFMVAAAEQPISAQILLDGKPIGDRGGADVINSRVTIQPEQLYRLVEDGEWGEHTLEIIVDEPGLQAFTFTFG